MTDRQFFAVSLKDEMPRFDRLLKAVPKNKLKYRPHPKSRRALELLDLFGNESADFEPFLKSGVLDYSKNKHKKFKSPAQTATALKKNLLKTVKMVAKMTEAKWSSKAKMISGEHVYWETTRGVMAWGLLLDLIHHRGQLSVYIRPMGGKVPAIYGPSGDSNGK